MTHAAWATDADVWLALAMIGGAVVLAILIYLMSIATCIIACWVCSTIINRIELAHARREEFFEFFWPLQEIKEDRILKWSIIWGDWESRWRNTLRTFDFFPFNAGRY